MGLATCTLGLLAGSGCNCETTRPEVLGELAFLEAEPASLELVPGERQTMQLRGALAVDAAHEIRVSDVPDDLVLLNVNPGVRPMGTIIEFHEVGDATFAVDVSVECIAPASAAVEFVLVPPDRPDRDTRERDELEAALSDTVMVRCAPPSASSTSSTGDAGDDDTTTGDDAASSGGESTTGGDATTTGSDPADASLVCRNLFDAAISVVTFDGPNAGVEAFDVGGFVAGMAVRPGEPGVAAGWFSEAGGSGFASWDAALDILDEPAHVIADEAASGYAVACSASEATIFGGFGVPAVRCDFEAGTCEPMGFSFDACACTEDTCLFQALSGMGLLRSTDGGLTTAPVADLAAGSSLQSNGLGALALYDGSTASVVTSTDAGLTFDTAVLPAGGMTARPSAIFDGVAFMQDVGAQVLVRSTDDLASWQLYDLPGTVNAGLMTQGPDGRLLLVDNDGATFLSADATGEAWEARPDLVIPAPFQCAPVLP
ncbi:MAG: hypothetical protein AAGA54_30615 [Myxococcota bacterium]